MSFKKSWDVSRDPEQAQIKRKYSKVCLSWIAHKLHFVSGSHLAIGRDSSGMTAHPNYDTASQAGINPWATKQPILCHVGAGPGHRPYRGGPRPKTIPGQALCLPIFTHHLNTPGYPQGAPLHCNWTLIIGYLFFALFSNWKGYTGLI